MSQLQAQQPRDSRSAFVRGLFFGIGGAVLGLILYAAFGILTGLVVGYVSLAVGYIVGKAMKLGSGGMGGRHYQLAAAVLTYAAVSMAAIPMSVSEAIKEKKTKPPVQAEQLTPDGSQTSTAQPAGKDSASHMSFGAAIGMLAIIGLASPFLGLQDPLHGVIGLVILFVGIRIAWQLTAGVKLDILGPFRVAASTPAAPTT